MRRALALIDDRIVPEEQATIHWNDPGFRRGYGVFETIRVAGARPFLAGCHALRLHEGAPRLGIVPWLHPRTLVRRLERLVRETGTVDGVLRVFLTPGPSPEGEAPAVPASIAPGIPMTTGPRPTRARYLATITSREPAPASARAMLAPHLRDARSPLVGVKTLSYAEEQLLLALARARGFDEALRRNLDGRLTEGTWSNLFVIEDSRLVTPPLSEGLLAGITRWFVLRTARDCGLEPREEPVPVERLMAAGEAFVTSTTRGIVPLVGVDGRPIGTGAPGERSVRLRRSLERHITRGREAS